MPSLGYLPCSGWTYMAIQACISVELHRSLAIIPGDSYCFLEGRLDSGLQSFRIASVS